MCGYCHACSVKPTAALVSHWGALVMAGVARVGIRRLAECGYAAANKGTAKRRGKDSWKDYSKPRHLF